MTYLDRQTSATVLCMHKTSAAVWRSEERVVRTQYSCRGVQSNLHERKASDVTNWLRSGHWLGQEACTMVSVEMLFNAIFTQFISVRDSCISCFRDIITCAKQMQKSVCKRIENLLAIQ